MVWHQAAHADWRAQVSGYLHFSLATRLYSLDSRIFRVGCNNAHWKSRTDFCVAGIKKAWPPIGHMEACPTPEIAMCIMRLQQIASNDLSCASRYCCLETKSRSPALPKGINPPALPRLQDMPNIYGALALHTSGPWCLGTLTIRGGHSLLPRRSPSRERGAWLYGSGDAMVFVGRRWLFVSWDMSLAASDPDGSRLFNGIALLHSVSLPEIISRCHAALLDVVELPSCVVCLPATPTCHCSER